MSVSATLFIMPFITAHFYVYIILLYLWNCTFWSLVSLSHFQPYLSLQSTYITAHSFLFSTPSEQPWPSSVNLGHCCRAVTTEEGQKRRHRRAVLNLQHGDAHPEASVPAGKAYHRTLLSSIPLLCTVSPHGNEIKHRNEIFVDII